MDEGLLRYGTWDGGGIYLTGPFGDIKMKEVVVEKNHADSEGGGIYAHAGFLFYTASKIKHNKARKKGGGILVYKANIMPGSVAAFVDNCPDD